MLEEVESICGESLQFVIYVIKSNCCGEKNCKNYFYELPTTTTKTHIWEKMKEGKIEKYFHAVYCNLNYSFI